MRRRAAQLSSSIGLISLLVLIQAAPAGAAEDPACKRSLGANPPSTAGAELPPTTFESTGPADPMNLGGNDDTGSVDITVTSSPALPPGVTSGQITLEIPKRFKRSGEQLETEFIDAPMFSDPRILERGKLVAFSLCVDAGNIEAGSYLGQIIVGGPPGVEPATVAVTVNRKDGTGFLIGFILALLLALILLGFQAVKTEFDKDNAGGSNAAKAWKATKTTGANVMGFWAPTLIAIAAAGAAMIQVYANDVSWGSDTLSSILALLGTAIAAAGLGTFISSLRGR